MNEQAYESTAIVVSTTRESDADAGDKYIGLDRFGRKVDQRWLKTSTGTTLDRMQYGYDREGKPLWRDNLVNSAYGELYAFDDLSQQTLFQHGTLNRVFGTLTGAASRICLTVSEILSEKR